MRTIPVCSRRRSLECPHPMRRFAGMQGPNREIVASCRRKAHSDTKEIKMGILSQSDKDATSAEPAPHAIVIREQLRRLVAHLLFTNSKRYPVLLTYIVEQTLLGNAGELKERTIGIEAFGREPSYD